MEILTPLEESQFKATKAYVVKSGITESRRVRTEYVKNEVKKLVDSGIPMQQAKIIIESRCARDLLRSDKVHFDNGIVATIEEILASPGTFDGLTMPDPLEPEAGPCKAKLFANLNTGNPIIHSQLHGGFDYYLRNSANPAGKKKWFESALDFGHIDRFLDFQPPPLDWVFQGSLLARTTGMLVGPGAVGKSTLQLLMLMAVATGRDILPGIFTPTRPGKVLGVFCEDDEGILHHRIHSMVGRLFYLDTEAQAQLRKNMIVITTTGHDVRLLSASAKTLEESQLFREIFDAVKKVDDLRLIMLDPVSRFHGGEENDNAVGTFLVCLLEQIAQITGAAVIAVHHVSKRAGIGSKGFDLEDAMHQDVARGASGLTNGVRWQCNLFGLPGQTAKTELGVQQAAPGQYLALKVCKKNYGPPEPIHFLERQQGNYLKPCTPAIPNKVNKIDYDINGMILNCVGFAERNGKVLTKRMLLDGYVRQWKEDNPQITRSAVEQIITACILSEDLYEHRGKNGSGRVVTYLSLKPDPGVDAGSVEPENEPEAIEPEAPESTGYG